MPLVDRIHNSGTPPVIVAELSGNHAQSFETAEKIIRLAVDSGVDAVKLQTYTADSLTLPSRENDFVVEGGLWDGQSLHELYQRAATPYEWHRPLKKIADQLGVTLFSTPFDEAAVDFLEEAVQPELYKISSFEATHIPLLERTGRTRKPTLLSVGMATENEIEDAVLALKDNGCPEVILLKCVSAYPSEAKDFNLRSMQTLATRFKCPIGLSDHSLDNDIAIAATALGARLIEKHVTDDRAAGGIDAGFSLEPEELAQLVVSTRRAHSALGSHSIGATKQDAAQLKYRRSIYVSNSIRKGETLDSTNIKIVRPSFGLEPKQWKDALGKKATRDLKPGTPLSSDDFA